MKDRKLILEPQFDGIYVREEGDEKYGAYISNDRKIRIEPSKTFSEENLQKIQDLAYSSNMIITDGKFRNRFALSIINMKPTKEHVDNIKDEVNQLYIETVDGKEYVCTRNGEIFPGKPEDYNDIPIIANPEGKKYILTDYTCQVDGQTLYRIRAVKSFPGVKAGELGGYVAGEHNLSQYGNSWIQTDSKVFNLAYVGDNAIVRKSIMYGNAKAIENCRVIHTTMYGDSIIKGFAISNNSYIYHKSVICGESRVSGHLAFEGIIKDKVFIKDPGARITGIGIEISDEVQISENVKIDGHAKIRGRSRIMGNSEITDYAEISGEAIIKDNVCVGGKSRIWDSVILSGYVKVNGRALIREHAELYDHVIIADSVEVAGNAKVKDNVVLSGCCLVSDNTKISGNARVTDYARIYSHVQIRGNAYVGGMATLTGGVCICENGQVDGNLVLSGDSIVKGNTRICTQDEADKIFKPSVFNNMSNENSL